LMAREHTDYTLAFRHLALFARGTGATPEPLRDLFIDRAAIDAWGARYLRRLELEPNDDARRQVAMRSVNPAYVLRNHLAQAAIEQAEAGDYTEVRQLHEVLRHPYATQPGRERYADLPPDWARGIEVSCSS
ncbi:MAG TPA: protein adenylyltransferase SelO family protein, partial [Burkholderiaceae bacterium]|nr:protein adenylyltransferase SelO family protein [Burkholderiaceae bacterium]